MSANNCLVFFGLRYEIAADAIAGLEQRTDSRLQVAREAKLNVYWGNFAGSDERYLLFIGTQIGLFGPEAQLDLELPIERVQEIASDTEARLAKARFEGAPALFVQWEEDA